MQCHDQLQFITLHAQTTHPGGDDVDILGLAAELQAQYSNLLATCNQVLAQQEQVKRDIEKLSGSTDFHSPCQQSLEPVLQEHGIQRQVYHGGAFIGNMSIKP